ncbi:uncharacterized protein A1O5_05842 [Cladophialophora psammophila CBS 110553]|uniref:Uncharacterized protein n=1 Tax=Cladophialophora psammophila CBS 110553 TaxID=1182543 RepID=W9X1S5_9EURO|nr:uncharacterized protein A1O5_05842 [Cladophialophora psammophila CBS 110553]EXJ70851.1 hypothetical protein A1O5_05842 [Cladophialophora psammophila CBS 110553]
MPDDQDVMGQILVDVVKISLDAGAPVDQGSASRDICVTPFTAAEEEIFVNAVELMVEHGATFEGCHVDNKPKRLAN